MDQHGTSHPAASRRRGPGHRAALITAVFAAGAALTAGTSSAQAIVNDGSSNNFQTNAVSSQAVATMGSAVSSQASTKAATAVSTTWPTAKGNVKVTTTTKVSGTFDGGLKRFSGIGDGSQGESQPPMFEVADGGIVKNVILGSPAGDGIHCLGTCTIQNVWWEDVGEDAATQKGTTTNQVMTIDGGGAQKASDKIFQHNGPGTVVIKNFVAKDFGKLYRSCGNCKKQFKRTLILSNVTVIAPGKVLAGVNTNLGDKATITGITILGDSNKKIHICDRFTGNSTGAEPTKIGSGADGKSCIFTASDITYKCNAVRCGPRQARTSHSLGRTRPSEGCPL
jgi:hypothetical protein